MISTDKLEYKFSQGNTRVHILCMYAIYVRMYVYVYDECSHISFSMRIMVGRCKNNSLAVFSLLVMSKVVQFKKKNTNKQYMRRDVSSHSYAIFIWSLLEYCNYVCRVLYCKQTRKQKREYHCRSKWIKIQDLSVFYSMFTHRHPYFDRIVIITIYDNDCITHWKIMFCIADEVISRRLKKYFCRTNKFVFRWIIR